MSSLSQVIDQMQGNGLPMLPSGHPVLDGKIHRFGPQKKAWYSLREVDLKSGARIIGGAFGVWRGQDNNAVTVAIDWKGISPEERAAAEAKQREYDELERVKRALLAENAANRAQQQWDAGLPAVAGAPSASPYLQRKQVQQENARTDPDGTLLVPMRKYSRDGTQLVGLQKVTAEGEKRFNKGMDKIGAACLLGALPDDVPVIMIAEGYATAGSLRLAVDGERPVMVAFDAGNLLAVAQGLRRDFPHAHLLFAADDDYLLEQRLADRLREEFKLLEAVAVDGIETDLTADDGTPVQVTARWCEDNCGVRYIEADVRCGRQMRMLKFENAGISRARAAAKAVGDASVVYPIFTERAGKKWTDFNDLQVEESIDAVRTQINAAIEAMEAVLNMPSAPTLHLVKTPTPSVDEAARSSDAAPADAPAGGQGSAPKKKKPKKEYGSAHWDTVQHLMDNFTLIYGDDTAWDDTNRVIIKIAHLRLAFGSDAVKHWLNNPDRRMVNKDCVVFDPTLRSDPDSTVNLFNGFKMSPRKGQCDKIVELLLHLCNGDVLVMAWVLRWIAYPLQHHGAKMRTSIIIHGDEGSGKNLLWENVVAKIYGEYGGVIGNAQIESQFNEWASKKLFFVADEVVTRNELRQLKGKLKHMVTGEVIMINPKGMTERAEANHMNFVFLSNELQPLALDKTDRRYLVLWTPPKREEAFYAAVAKQIREGGIEAFYHYLMHDVPCGDFNEHTKPLETEAKSKLISLGLSPPERFYREWAGGFLPLPFMCCSAMQLYLGFCRWSHLNGERFPVTQTMFGRTTDRVGAGETRRAVIKYAQGEDVKQRTVYLVGDQPEDKQSRAEWVEAASAVFEEALKKYRHVYDQPNE